MRTTIIPSLLIGLTLMPFGAPEAGQFRGNPLSPHESVTGSIDGADITITYGRPSMRGRRIMGGLVPYTEDWTPGADDATTLETSKPLLIGQVMVPAGIYSVWMRPRIDDWTMFLNSNANLFHTAIRNRRFDLEAIALTKRMLEQPVEQLTFVIQQGSSGSGGEIKMLWELTELSMPVMVVN